MISLAACFLIASTLEKRCLNYNRQYSKTKRRQRVKERIIKFILDKQFSCRKRACVTRTMVDWLKVEKRCEYKDRELVEGLREFEK